SALAAEAATLGADVTVVAANVTLDRDPRVRYVDVETAQELQDACAAAFPSTDIVLMAAAVVDFRPAAAFDGKLKKAEADELRLEVMQHLIIAVLAGGHALIEDLPGVGKTTLARALARSLNLEFARIQCTADLLPADVVGTNVFNQRESRFEFRPGPIFANVVLVDEINRASPKTQSGLLECMQE